MPPVMDNVVKPTDSDHLNKAYLSHKGYYLIGFTTKIKKATKRDIELAYAYGLELVCSYHKLNHRLVYSTTKEENFSVSSQETIYYMMLGKLTIGKLAISIQKVAKRTTIIYIYKYKDNPFHFKNNTSQNLDLGKETDTIKSSYKKNFNNLKRSRQLKNYMED